MVSKSCWDYMYSSG